MLSIIVSLMINLVASAPRAPHEACFIRTEIADGSVWADVWDARGGTCALRSTVRLGRADERLRYVVADVDGDGWLDIIAFARDGRDLQVWRGADDGSFVRIE